MRAGLACGAESEQFVGGERHGVSFQAQTLPVTSAGGPAGPGCLRCPWRSWAAVRGPGGRERPVVTEQSPLGPVSERLQLLESY